MDNDAIMKRLERAAISLDLLEANGRIDGEDGKDKRKGWEELCAMMKISPFGHHAAYRTSYENGWYEGYQRREKK